GQAMLFFEPLVAAMLRLPDYRRFARLVERREAMAALTRLIESRADAAHEARRAARARRGPPANAPPPARRMPVSPGTIRSILATDCGSTTTKAILIERQGDQYRLVVRGEAPTTVEAPFEDVTRGVLNAVREVEELAGRRILDGDRIVSPQA